MQHVLNNNELNLSVKKSPLFVRGTFYFFTLISIAIPIFITYSIISSREGLKFGYFIGMLLSGLIFLYLIRVSLWNTFGTEKIIFDEKMIHYEANYGWFKDGKRSVENQNILLYINPIGFGEDKSSVLIISNDSDQINCSAKIPIEELNSIINKLNKELIIR